jgi:hypothetical protein
MSCIIEHRHYCIHAYESKSVTGDKSNKTQKQLKNIPQDRNISLHSFPTRIYKNPVALNLWMTS